MPDVHLCEVIENAKLTNSAYAITVRADEIASAAKPGQFLNISCGAEKLLRRPISIAAADNNSIRFVFETRGSGTSWLSERRKGDVLDILGPLGNSFSISGGNIVLVGGGIGAPPMLFAAKSAENACTAILGFCGKASIMLKNEFDSVCKEVHIATDDGSAGIHGTVTIPLEELLKKGGTETVLACGPRGMLSAVAALCVEYSVYCQVSMEERMACGVGACLVCACRTVKEGNEHMSRVCKDGPVFDADKVVF